MKNLTILVTTFLLTVAAFTFSLSKANKTQQELERRVTKAEQLNLDLVEKLSEFEKTNLSLGLEIHQLTDELDRISAKVLRARDSYAQDAVRAEKSKTSILNHFESIRESAINLQDLMRRIENGDTIDESELEKLHRQCGSPETAMMEALPELEREKTVTEAKAAAFKQVISWLEEK